MGNCPLCQSQDNKVVEFITSGELREIWRFGNIKNIDQYIDNDLYLRECKECGLQFFSPLVFKNKNFYDLFISDKKHRNYYGLNWDHKVISNYILNNGTKSILDYGCGSAMFLKSLPEEIFKVGVDLNAEGSKSHNIEICKGDVLSFKYDKKFEAVTCIQFLEHVINPVDHMKKMVDLLQVGGYLFISVPNRNGVMSHIENRCRSLDFPPHHFTRWSKQSLEKLARFNDLQILDIIEEDLSFIHYKWLMNSLLVTNFGFSLKDRILRKSALFLQSIFLSSWYYEMRQFTKGQSILIVLRK